MGVKAAAFPSFAGGSTTDRSTTRDYETGNERAATRYRTEGTGLESAYSDSGAGGSVSTSTDTFSLLTGRAQGNWLHLRLALDTTALRFRS